MEKKKEKKENKNVVKWFGRKKRKIKVKKK